METCPPYPKAVDVIGYHVGSLSQTCCSSPPDGAGQGSAVWRVESQCHGHLYLFGLRVGRVEGMVPVHAPLCQVGLNSSFDLGGFAIAGFGRTF